MFTLKSERGNVAIFVGLVILVGVLILGLAYTMHTGKGGIDLDKTMQNVSNVAQNACDGLFSCNTVPACTVYTYADGHQQTICK